MTSSTILTAFTSTNSMFGKYSIDSALMDLLPVQIIVSSMALPVITLNICCHLKASPWPQTTSRSSKIGQHHKKSRIFNLSSALPTSTIISFMDIQKSQFCLCVLPARVPLGISPMSAILPLKHLKRLSPQLWSLPIGSQTQITVETDASDYALTAVLSITTPNGELHPIAIHSQTFSTPELNYDVHNKELAIFEAFKRWRHYLKGSGLPIDMVTDHRNLQYFSTTKILTRRQAQWSEYLSRFNLIIRFHPRKLRTKPDTLTRQWDIYLKEGNSYYASVNPQNFCLVFTSEQLASSL